MRVRVCAYVRACTRMFVCLCACKYMLVHARMRVRVCACACARMCVCACACARMCVCVCAYVDVRVRVCGCASVRLRVCICVTLLCIRGAFARSTAALSDLIKNPAVRAVGNHTTYSNSPAPRMRSCSDDTTSNARNKSKKPLYIATAQDGHAKMSPGSCQDFRQEITSLDIDGRAPHASPALLESDPPSMDSWRIGSPRRLLSVPSPGVSFAVDLEE